jgi:hypothetical protein
MDKEIRAILSKMRVNIWVFAASYVDNDFFFSLSFLFGCIFVIFEVKKDA